MKMSRTVWKFPLRPYFQSKSVISKEDPGVWGKGAGAPPGSTRQLPARAAPCTGVAGNGMATRPARSSSEKQCGPGKMGQPVKPAGKVG